MQTKSMTFRLPLALANALEAKAKRTGTDRTDVVITGLTQWLGLPLPAPEPLTLVQLQTQIEQLSNSMSRLTEQLVALRRLPTKTGESEPQ